MNGLRASLQEKNIKESKGIMRNYSSLGYLTQVFIILGLVIAFVPENTTLPYKLSAGEMLEEIQIGSEFIHPDELADLIINKDPSFQLIDVRSTDEFQKYSLPGAINIPLNLILADEWSDILNQDTKMNIFYSNGSTLAHKAWMIIRQVGFENNYLLQGGLNYWLEVILNPQKPKSTDPNDEFAKYNFRKGARQFFETSSPSTGNVREISAPKPIIKRTKKKKAPQGGC